MENYPTSTERGHRAACWSSVTDGEVSVVGGFPGYTQLEAEGWCGASSDK